MYIVLKYFRILVCDFLLAINRILQSNALKVICLNNIHVGVIDKGKEANWFEICILYHLRLHNLIFVTEIYIPVRGLQLKSINGIKSKS